LATTTPESDPPRQPRSPRRRRAAFPGAAAALTALPALLAALLYGRHLAEGLVADDFEYASWARAGLGTLLRHVTVDSSPQMVRPLPGLAWMLAILPLGAALLHGLSVLLHAANGLLIAASVRRRGPGSAGHAAGAGDSGAARAAGAGEARSVWMAAASEPGSAWTAAAFAALFVAFPLFTEPVVWLSGSFDLWACCFALAAIRVADLGPRGAAPAAAGGLFLAALLCKESVVCLPLILPLLLPWRRVRRAAGAMLAVAAVYVLARLLMFSGPGGYQRGDGGPLLWSAAPRQLWMMAQRLPQRVLVPFKGAAAAALPALLCALLSVLLIGGFLLAAMRARRGRGQVANGTLLPGPTPALAPAPPPGVPAAGSSPAARRLLLPVAALLLALLPVAHLLWIDVDQEGSRLLYFPMAVFAIALGRRAPALSAPARALAAALVCYWGVATLWNGRAWTRASWEVEHTLAAMARLAPRLPPHALAFVAGHDSWQGAYTWRNGVAAAARWRGLRPDVSWLLGTAALLDSPAAELGRNAFEIGIDDAGRPVDWTPCELALLAAPAPAGGTLVRWVLPFPPPPGRDPVSPDLPLPGPLEDLQLRLELGGGRPPRPTPGRLYWRPSGAAHFASVNSATFLLWPQAGGEIVLRLHPEPPRPIPGLKLWLHMPSPAVESVRAIRVAAAPASCSPGVARAPGR
jgi:hypothetical protein